MSAARAALHQLIDRLPEDALPEAAEALARIGLSPEEETGIRRGLDAAARGETVAVEQVFAGLRARIARTPG